MVRGRFVGIVTLPAGAVFNLSQAIDTAAVWIETTDLDMTRADLTKVIRKIVLDLEGRDIATGLQLTIKYKNFPAETFQSYGPVQIGGLEGPLAVRPPRAKIYRLRFDDISIQTRWKLSDFELFGGIGGARL